MIVSTITIDKYSPNSAFRLRFSKNICSASICLAEWRTTCLASFMAAQGSPTIVSLDNRIATGALTCVKDCPRYIGLPSLQKEPQASVRALGVA
jgi:hypothetical protein